MRKTDIEAIKDIIHIQQKEYDKPRGNGNPDYAEGYVQACEDVKNELADYFVDWED